MYCNGVIKKIFMQPQPEEDQEEIESEDSNDERLPHEIIQAIATGKAIAALDALVDKEYCRDFWITIDDNNSNKKVNALGSNQ